jgi:hypothetical protein
VLTKSLTRERIILCFEHGELACLLAVLNEVRNGFHLSDFLASIGLSREEASDLREKIAERGPCLPLTMRELLAIRNSIRETARELGEEEFSTRTAVSLADAKEISDAIDQMLSTMQGA